MSAVLAEHSHQAAPAAAPSHKPVKWKRVLAALLSGGTFNRFESVRELRDWCLPTTIAALEARGLRIDRADETVPGFSEIPTHCKRYALRDEASRRRARELLGMSPP